MEADTVFSLLSVDLDADPTDPPTNDEDEYICGRECLDGSVCLNRSPIPFLACPSHDLDAPPVG